MVALSPLWSYLFSVVAFSAASPIIKSRDSGITLSFATRLNVIGGFADYLKTEQARAHALIYGGSDSQLTAFNFLGVSATSIPVTNIAVTYTMKVSIGNPPTDYSLLVDSGSANTWIGANKPYTPTNSSTNTSEHVAANYGSGGFSGTQFIDRVDLGEGLVIANQSIGVANKSAGTPDGVDGVLGIGPTTLTVKTTAAKKEIPTVMDNLVQTCAIPANLLGVFFAPPTFEGDTNGELTFGSIDSSKVKGAVTYVPITATAPATNFWGINQTITYGRNNTGILNSSGILDTGTSLTLITSDAFQRYSQAVGATIDAATGLLKLNDISKLESLYFTIGGTTFDFTPEAQQWPKKFNELVGGDSNATYLVVGDMKQPSGGLDFILGYTWLEQFYTVFDADNKRVGIANVAI